MAARMVDGRPKGGIVTRRGVVWGLVGRMPSGMRRCFVVVGVDTVVNVKLSNFVNLQKYSNSGEQDMKGKSRLHTC